MLSRKHFCEITFSHHSGNKNFLQLIKNTNLIHLFEVIKEEFSTKALYEIIKRLSKAKEKLDRNVNLTVLADNLLFEILEVKYLCK